MRMLVPSYLNIFSLIKNLREEMKMPEDKALFFACKDKNGKSRVLKSS